MRRLAVLFVVVLGASATTAFAATLSVTTWHLWSGSQTLVKPIPCTLTGAAMTTDTYVDEALPTSTFPTATTLSVRAATGGRRWTFIRFDLASCAIPTTGGADVATLRLRMTTAPGTSRTLTVTPVLSTWLAALTAVQASALPLDTPTTTFATGTVAATLSVPVTIDVDELIKTAGANFGWLINDLGTGTATTTFGSSENTTSSNRPQLVINYEK
jgi:hypothetical protein